MNALTLYIIRHAEKMDAKDPDSTGPGFTHRGKQDDESLVIKGWERAGAWTALFLAPGLVAPPIFSRARSTRQVLPAPNRIPR